VRWRGLARREARDRGYFQSATRIASKKLVGGEICIRIPVVGCEVEDVLATRAIADERERSALRWNSTLKLTGC
jgi:hypothetical protein